MGKLNGLKTKPAKTKKTSLGTGFSDSGINLRDTYDEFKKAGDATGMYLSWACAVESIVFESGKSSQMIEWYGELDAVSREHAFPSQDVEMAVLSSLFLAATEEHWNYDMDRWIDRAHALSVGVMHSLEIANDSGLRCFDSALRMMSSAALYLLMRRGEVKKAEGFLDVCRRAISVPGIEPKALIMAMLADVYYYQLTADSKRIAESLKYGMKASGKAGTIYLEYLMKWAAALGALNTSDAKAARELISGLSGHVAKAGLYHKACYSYLMSCEALRAGDFSQGADLIEKSIALAADSDTSLLAALNMLLKSIILFESGRGEDAWEALTYVFYTGHRMKSLTLEFSALLLRAYYLYSEGKDNSAYASLKRALSMGFRQGLFITHIWPASIISNLFTKAVSSGIETDYVREFIKRCGLLPEPSCASDDWPYPVKVYALGGFYILTNDKPLAFIGSLRKPLLMLKALIASGGVNVDTLHLMDILWPDSDGDRASRAFDTTLIRLRRILGDARAIHLKGSRLSLDYKYCYTDVQCFEHASDNADEAWRKAVQMKSYRDAENLTYKAIDIYSEGFLPMDLNNSWSNPIREKLKRKALGLILKMGGHLQQAGRLEESLECFYKGLEIDDLSETVYQNIMWLNNQLGRRAEAVKAYKRCCIVLEESLGICPSQKTKDIYSKI